MGHHRLLGDGEDVLGRSGRADQQREGGRHPARLARGAERLSRQLIGSYVFFWGEKQERTPTWFGLLLRKRRADRVGGRHAVRVDGLVAREPRAAGERDAARRQGSPQQRHAGGRQTYEAAFDVVDPDGDPLRYRWEVKPESDATQAGGDLEARIRNISGLLGNAAAPITPITVRDPGRYGCSPTRSTITGTRRTPTSRSWSRRKERHEAIADSRDGHARDSGRMRWSSAAATTESFEVRPLRPTGCRGRPGP